MELKLTKQRVLDAAESCELARDVLQILFPDIFTRTIEAGNVVKLITKWGYTVEAVLVSLRGGKLTFITTEDGAQITKDFYGADGCLDIATVLKAEPEIAEIEF